MARESWELRGAVAGLAVVACASPTQLLVEVRPDPALDPVSAIVVEVRDASTDSPTAGPRSLWVAGTDWMRSFAVVPLGGDASRRIRLVVTACATDPGPMSICPPSDVIASQSVRAGFVSGRKTEIRLVLSTACTLRDCADDEVCVASGGVALCRLITPPDGGAPGDCLFSAVAGGQWHTCAVRDDGSLWCWGWSNVGQLGLGSVQEIDVPTRVGLDRDWVDVTGGEGHTCGLRRDGSVWCWGWNSSGQLGTLDLANRTEPARVVGGPFSEVRAGYRFTCASHVDGSLYCWGENRQGQLGQGVLGNRNYLSRVGTATDWDDFRVPPTFGGGGWHTCGVRVGSGTLWCWGWNSSGQLGLGDGTDRLEPTQVGTGTDWAGAAPSYWHSCAIRTNGTLWCWGRGYDGRLGLGDTTGRNAPAQVGTEATWNTVFGGGHHTCALRADGSIWCWGANTDGQLGVGDFASRATPTRLLRTWGFEATMGLGGNHSCAIDEGGALYCWGMNEHGVLGVGGTQRSATPLRVRCPPAP